MHIGLLITILIVATFEALGQSSLALARNHFGAKAAWFGVAAVACYACVAFGLYTAYQWKGVGMVNALWSSLSIILMIVIGHFAFSERLSFYEWVGVVFIVFGIVTTQINRPEK